MHLIHPLQLQERLNVLKRELKDVANLRQQASVLSKTQRDVERLEREIRDLERSLSDSGSLKTVQDIERELDIVVTELYVPFTSPLAIGFDTFTDEPMIASGRISCRKGTFNSALSELMRMNFTKCSCVTASSTAACATEALWRSALRT